MIRTASLSVTSPGEHLDETGRALGGRCSRRARQVDALQRTGRLRCSVRSVKPKYSWSVGLWRSAETTRTFFAGHAQRVREVCGDGALALPGDRRGDDDDRAVGAVEPEQREVRTDRPVGVGEEAGAGEVGEKLCARRPPLGERDHAEHRRAIDGLDLVDAAGAPVEAVSKDAEQDPEDQADEQADRGVSGRVGRRGAGRPRRVGEHRQVGGRDAELLPAPGRAAPVPPRRRRRSWGRPCRRTSAAAAAARRSALEEASSAGRAARDQRLGDAVREQQPAFGGRGRRRRDLEEVRGRVARDVHGRSSATGATACSWLAIGTEHGVRRADADERRDRTGRVCVGSGRRRGRRVQQRRCLPCTASAGARRTRTSRPPWRPSRTR